MLKIHGRCNLACDYCYLYEMADHSWQAKPAVMRSDVITQTMRRIAETAISHDQTDISLIFHGGEPLLAGMGLISFAASEARRLIPPCVRARLSLQTNGILLDRDVLAVLLEHGISVGVSLDGAGPDHDRHRRYRNKRGSYAQVIRGISMLRSEKFRELFAGLLCTIDLAADPLVTYASLAEQGAPVIDFLLPHGNWSARPPGRVADATQTPYADWLIAVFDHWYSGSPGTHIRLFDEIIHLCLGGQSTVESVGLSPVGLIVIETDGSLEQVDTLKSAFHGAAATGLNVFDHGFDTALAHPAVLARQAGADALCDQCRRCPLMTICGAGYYPHRYRAGSGYRNPSVYCPDLTKLIDHIRGRLAADLAACPR